MRKKKKSKRSDKKRKRRSPGSSRRLARAAVLEAVTPLQGVAGVLKRHSTVDPFPDPVTLEMSLFTDFRLAPLGREAMAPDLSELRKSLGKTGLVTQEAARKAQTVADLVKLVSA